MLFLMNARFVELHPGFVWSQREPANPMELTIAEAAQSMYINFRGMSDQCDRLQVIDDTVEQLIGYKASGLADTVIWHLLLYSAEYLDCVFIVNVARKFVMFSPLPVICAGFRMFIEELKLRHACNPRNVAAILLTMVFCDLLPYEVVNPIRVYPANVAMPRYEHFLYYILSGLFMNVDFCQRLQQNGGWPIFQKIVDDSYASRSFAREYFLDLKENFFIFFFKL